MTCGIYLGSPKNILTDKVYIGQSSNIEDRIRRHTADMRAGRHKKKIQDGYNKYGEFDWEILAECPVEQLHDLEKYYIKLFNACEEGFNTYEDSVSAPILYGLDNGNVKKENIQLYKHILDLTILNPTYTRYKIAELANTKEYVVAHIWYSSSCKWLSEIFPIEYEKVISLEGTRQVGGKSAESQGIVYNPILSPELLEYTITNVRKFSREYKLDQADLANVLNLKKPSVKGWIIKDLDKINPSLHEQFYSSNRGYYKKQFDLYKSN